MAELTVTLRLTGTKPLLMHNGRLANPLDQYTRALKALTAKRSKTDQDLFDQLQAEARGGIYETPDGMVGLPNGNVWRCLYDAAKAFKRGEDIKRALSTDIDETVPLLIPTGESVAPMPVGEYLAKWQEGTIDYRAARVQKNKVMRARPIIGPGWSSEHQFILLSDVINVGDLDPIIHRAGRLVGLCDYRPQYGTFTAEVVAS